LDAYSLDNEGMADSTILRSGRGPLTNPSGLPKVSKKMLKDKLKRAKQRNDQLAGQVKQL